jgi:uncharacterized protein with von Willebrand factor type A (vWA) domain
MSLPLAARPFPAFARLLRANGHPVAPEQEVAFMCGVTLLGPRSMDDIRRAALATLAPAPDRREEFEALFRAFFHGEGTALVEGDSEEDTEIRDDAGAEAGEALIHRQESGGELAAAAERLGVRRFDPDDDGLVALRRTLPAALPTRRSFRSVRARSRGSLDLRRSFRDLVRADGDIAAPRLRRRKQVARPLLILIDISGSMRLHTADHLKLAHAVVQAAPFAEVFTLGTRLTRITRALRLRDRDAALARVAGVVEDWDGGTRIGPTLLALLSVPRLAAMARGAAVVILSDALERGGIAPIETATRRLAARAWRLSLATPLAGDPRYRPETAALKAIAPHLDDLVDGSSVASLSRFLLSLADPPRTGRDLRRT